jgi:hypothetical protein
MVVGGGVCERIAEDRAKVRGSNDQVVILSDDIIGQCYTGKRDCGIQVLYISNFTIRTRLPIIVLVLQRP